jgi:hypothetical protein
MTELDMTADVDTEDFTDDLSDEALDREEERAVWRLSGCFCFLRANQ